MKPWPKKEKRRHYPSRAMLCCNGAKKATATWERHPHKGWWCCSAFWPLKWMRGMMSFSRTRVRLERDGWQCEWLPKGMATSPESPFELSRKTLHR